MPRQLDVQIAARRQLFEMVPGDVRVQREPFGDFGRLHAALRPHEQVDLTARRVPEGVGDGRDGGRELVRRQFRGRCHARYSTYADSGNARSEIPGGSSPSRRG